ncbi:hypothetical protein MUU77_15040 [Pseudoxanthomonas sp. F37]|jgi:hypothetical protein|uniref:hypothetical protein n=1 Tax=Pseudoxanthomonas TaxID=83618 RepID=UPI001FD57397|nr:MULTISPECIES: hypothetical protein [Pseudoxanthomonas]UOV06523.1 hypothetical protein MUU75_07810 [Pseudoxanthomonas mexicana]UOV08131.1 hypothetical protein MUU77_15040 [Pseudoxanthomonas sp. F37]
MRKLFVVSLMLLAIPVAQASMNAASGGASDAPQQLNVTVPFERQKEKIIADLGNGETYAEIKPEEQVEVRNALTRISDALQKAGGVDQLSAEDKAKVFNDQELVNTILTRAHEDSRLVCTREKKVGSHRITNTCKTVAERRRDREESQGALRRNMRVVCVPNVSCPGY